MPWKECTTVSLRRELVVLCQAEGANVALLCQRYGVSRKTAYKWLRRFQQLGEAGLADQSRRPHCSPGQTTPEMEQQVLAIRTEHPAWGGRKIRARLQHLGQPAVPAASPITAILHRHQRIGPEEAAKHRAWVRFERPEPNDLWQMDFKGHWALPDGSRCHPLTVLDDHSRFALGLRACDNERTETVQAALTAIFRRYGLPRGLLADNGPPWGGSGRGELTPLGVWLVRLGIGVHHGQPRHPETQGKDERFHRTLKAEVLGDQRANDLASCQCQFDRWRAVYNHERPHEALGMEVPARRYRPGPRTFPEALPPIEYGLHEDVRYVRSRGEIKFRGQRFYVAESLPRLPVALRPTSTDGVWDVYFCHQRVKHIDVRARAES